MNPHHNNTPAAAAAAPPGNHHHPTPPPYSNTNYVRPVPHASHPPGLPGAPSPSRAVPMPSLPPPPAVAPPPPQQHQHQHPSTAPSSVSHAALLGQQQQQHRHTTVASVVASPHTAAAYPPFPPPTAVVPLPTSSSSRHAPVSNTHWTVPNPLGMPGTTTTTPSSSASQPPPRLVQPTTFPHPQQQQQHPPQQQQHPPQQQQQHPQHPRNSATNTSTTASVPPPRSGVTVVPATSARDKPKVILSADAKQALGRAIYSALRSPNGTMDPLLVQAAVATGLPESAIRHAARVARERDAQKQRSNNNNNAAPVSQQVSPPPPPPQLTPQQQQHHHQQQQKFAQQQQQQLQQQHHQQKLAQQQQQQQQLQLAQQHQLAQQQLSQQRQQQAAHQHKQQQLVRQQQMLAQQEKVLVHQQKQIQQQQKLQQQQQAEMMRQKAIQEQQQQQQLKLQKRMTERSKWKRTHHAVFISNNKKKSFQAVPHSIGAIVKTSDATPVLHDSMLLNEAHRLQQELLRRGNNNNKKRPAENNNDHDDDGPTIVSLHDAERFKRVKAEPKKLAKTLDRVARKARQSVADTITKQYKELTKAIISHQNDFYKFHRQRRTDSFRMAKTIRDAMEKEEKKKGKDAVAQERARLAALKANDMTAYSKLLEETRNDRLKYLLEKTERHFTEISTLLQDRPNDEPAPSHGTTAAAVPRAATSYYASAHQHAEEVRQPSLLVGGDLKEYQLAGLHWMVSLYNNKLNGILADEMGLGKTIQAISLIAYLMEFKHNLGPFLVIVPLSTLSNWQNEFAKWCPSARTVCYKGTPIQRRDIFRDQIRAGHFNVLLTTYEYIIRDKKNLRPIVWQYAIVDEGHRMKNAGSKFAVTLGKEYTTKFRILLTGTPLMNDLSELWSLLNFLLPAVFNSVSTFDQWFSAPFAQFSGSSTNDDAEQDLLSNEERVLIIHRLHELLRPFMLRRVKSEVLDQLPEKVEKVLRCELSSWQKELYKQISKKAVAENGLLSATETTPVPTRGLNNIVMQLRKVCNHPYLFSPEGYHVNENIIRSSAKVALLDEMLPKLKAAGHRVLMFTQMTAVMNILEDFFALRGFRSLRLDGSTTAEEREKRMYQYNAPDSPCFIFLLSTRAGGLGLNLVSGDTVILFDSDWNPAMDLQAQDRAHRIGQRSDVSVFRLVTYSPVEEKILSRATEKMNVSQLVVESGKFNKDSVDSDNSLERKRLMELLLTDFDTAQPKNTTEKSGSDDEDDDAGSDASDKEDLNELLSNNEADFQLYSDYDKILEAKGQGPAPLFTSPSDVPDWILHPQETGRQSVFTATTDDFRKRKDVAYDDGLTEKQFMRMMDKQSIQEENAKKKQKKGKGRPVTKFSSIEEEEPLDLEPSGSSLLTDWTYRKLISCGKAVVALKDPSTKRRLSDIFLEKPDPATFPDYYELIEKPIAINDILRKCRAKIYDSISEFKDDWKLMFNNAAKFNGSDSWVVQDAQALEKELERILKKNGFVDDLKPPTHKEKKPLPRIRITLTKKS